MHRPCLTSILCLLSLPLAGSVRADDSLDSLLNNIPKIENAVDPDNAPREAEVPDVEFTTYAAQVQTQVLAGWKPSKGTIKKNPSIETRLVLIIDPSGVIQAIKPMVLSGDKKYDASAVAAVNALGTAAVPPPNLVSLARQGVVVTFNGQAWLRAR